MNGAVIGSVKSSIMRSFGNNMAYTLDKKIKELEFERNQVLHHLALLDANIDLLKKAIALTQSSDDITLYNTKTFTYRRKFRLFKVKVRKMLMQILRDNPTQAFTIAELTQQIFLLEKNTEQPTNKHLDAVHKHLNVFLDRDWITRQQVSRTSVVWQWKA